MVTRERGCWLRACAWATQEQNRRPALGKLRVPTALPGGSFDGGPSTCTDERTPDPGRTTLSFRPQWKERGDCQRARLDRAVVRRQGEPLLTPGTAVTYRRCRFRQRRSSPHGAPAAWPRSRETVRATELLQSLNKPQSPQSSRTRVPRAARCPQRQIPARAHSFLS